MQKLIVVVLMLVSGPAALAIANCDSEFPSVVAGSGPARGLTGLPLTYNYRLSCYPDGKAFVIGALKASYRSADADLEAVDSLIVSPIGEDFLFQALFLVPQDQPGGDYVIDGCQEVTQTSSAETRCVPIVKSALHLTPRLDSTNSM